jgi:hypothetical protein
MDGARNARVSDQHRWVWSVLAYVLLLLLGFLNPWLLVFFAVGALLGILARFVLHLMRRRRERVPPNGPSRGRRGLLILGAIAVSVAIMVAYLSLAGTRLAIVCRLSEYSVLYEGTGMGDTSAREWTVDHEITLSDEIFEQGGEAERMGTQPGDLTYEQVESELTAAGWSLSGTVDGQARFTQTQTFDLESRVYPLLTTTALTVPSPSWGPCGDGVELVPGKDSTLTLTAPAYLIVKTFPTALSSEDMFNGRWRWVVPAGDNATDGGVVRVRVASPLARSEVTSQLAELSLSSLLLWILAIIGGLFEVLLKEILVRPIRRVLEWLRILKPKASK